jgi:hypothetical protein
VIFIAFLLTFERSALDHDPQSIGALTAFERRVARIPFASAIGAR